MALNLESITSTGSAVLNTGAIVLIALIPISIVIVLFLYMRNQKKFAQFTCIIFGKDGFGHGTVFRNV